MNDLPQPALPPASSPADFQQVARKLSRWTLNGLATALVLVLGLAGGREIIQWWHDDPAVLPSQEVSPKANDLSQMMRQVQFGSTGVLTQAVTGNAEFARATLRKLCLQTVAGDDFLASFHPAPLRPGEQKMLAQLANRQPLATEGASRLYELTAPLPMMAVSCPASREANAPLRIAALGIALPTGDNRWSVYAFRSGANRAFLGEDSSAATTLPLPTDSKLTLSLQLEDRRILTAFHGQGKLDDWEQFFRDQVRNGSWRTEGPWQILSDRRLVILVATGNSPCRCELQFGEDGPQRLWGFVTVSH